MPGTEKQQEQKKEQIKAAPESVEQKLKNDLDKRFDKIYRKTIDNHIGYTDNQWVTYRIELGIPHNDRLAYDEKMAGEQRVLTIVKTNLKKHNEGSADINTSYYTLTKLSNGTYSLDTEWFTNDKKTVNEDAEQRLLFPGRVKLDVIHELSIEEVQDILWNFEKRIWEAETAKKLERQKKLIEMNDSSQNDLKNDADKDLESKVADMA